MWPTDPSISDELRPLLEVGFLVSRLGVGYEVNHPQVRVLENELRAQFPKAILDDPGADWSLWAGDPGTLQGLHVEVAP